MSRIEEVVKVQEQGIASVVYFKTTTKRTLLRYTVLGNAGASEDMDFYDKHGKTRNQEYCDAIGQWLAKH